MAGLSVLGCRAGGLRPINGLSKLTLQVDCGHGIANHLAESSVSEHRTGMTLASSVRETIAAVGAVLKYAEDPWWIVTGAAAAIHGATPITVSDVDVMLSVRDASHLFSKLGIQAASPSTHPRFRSEVFGQWEGNPLVVEFMANFQLRDLDGVWRPMLPTTRQRFVAATTTVYVPELAELREMFGRFGRPKDHERIRLIDQMG